jgi:hypothetical protein
MEGDAARDCELDNVPDPVRAGQWTRMVIKGFWNITEGVWKARKGKFHGKDPAENRAKVKENLRRDSRRITSQDRLLTRHTREGILKSSYATPVTRFIQSRKIQSSQGG